MKRILSLTMMLMLLLAWFTMSAQAVETDCQTVHFDDGSYLKITIHETNIRASGSKTGTKNYQYYNTNNELSWSALLRGTFTYNGTSAICTSSVCNVTIYNSSWYEVSKTVGRSGATATCELTMGHKVLGITVSKKNVSMTLTCGANGNLS